MRLLGFGKRDARSAAKSVRRRKVEPRDAANASRAVFTAFAVMLRISLHDRRPNRLDHFEGLRPRPLGELFGRAIPVLIICS